MEMKKIIFLIVTIFLFSSISATAISDELHLNIQTRDSNGNIVTGTFKFDFNITLDNNRYINNSLRDINFGSSTDNVTVSNSVFSSNVSGSFSGRIVFTGNEMTIQNNVFGNATDSTSIGVAFIGVNNGLISDNVWNDENVGIVLSGSDNITAGNNTLTDIISGGVVAIDGSSNVVFDNNTLVNIGNSTYAAIFISNFDGSTVSNVTVSNSMINNSLGRTLTAEGSFGIVIENNMVDNSTLFAIFLNETNDTVVNLNDIMNVGEGNVTAENESSISLVNTTNITVTNNNVSFNDFGVIAQQATNTTIRNNLVKNNSGGGIKVGMSSFNTTIAGNTLLNNLGNVISVSASNSSAVYGNTMVNNSFPLFISVSSDSKVYNNQINNSWCIFICTLQI